MAFVWHVRRTKTLRLALMVLKYDAVKPQLDGQGGEVATLVTGMTVNCCVYSVTVSGPEHAGNERPVLMAAGATVLLLLLPLLLLPPPLGVLGVLGDDSRAPVGTLHVPKLRVKPEPRTSSGLSAVYTAVDVLEPGNTVTTGKLTFVPLARPLCASHLLGNHTASSSARNTRAAVLHPEVARGRDVCCVSVLAMAR
jgi:hypothetical protein